MFSLSILFLTLPLYFSHIFMHFGVVIGDGASFERQKMYLFFFIVCIALVEMILTRYDDCVRLMREYWYVFLGVLLIPFVPTVLYGGSIDIYWIRGSYEKFHGFLLYVGILLLGFSLSIVGLRERRRLVNMSLISASIVSVVAILEAFGFSIFLPTHSGAWGEGLRTISTMGNPNYLAGYLLLMLPLIGYIRIPERWILTLLITVALFTTGSYIGIGLGIMYGIYMLSEWVYSSFRARQSVSVIADEKSSISRTISDTLFGRLLTRNRDKRVRNDKIGNSWTPLLITLIIAGGVMILGYLYLPPDKLLSFTSRWVLMREVASQLVSYPLALFTGFGPESILRFFMGVRSDIIDSYFPPESLIDSSHNILLDIVFQYGIVPVLFIGWYIRRNWQILHPSARVGSILGILFLMGNPYVIVHIVLISLLLTYHDNRR